MKVDRYTKVLLTVIAVALSALAINYIIAPQPAVAAAPALGEGRYQLVGNTVIDTRLGTIFYAPSLPVTLRAASSVSAARLARVMDLTENGYASRR